MPLYYCHSDASDLTSQGTATFNRDAYHSTEEWPGNGTAIDVVLGAGATTTVAWYTTAGRPGVTSLPTGDYTGSVNVSAAGADITVQLSLRRVNSSGVLQATMATNTAAGGTGVKTVTWSPGSPVSVDAGDRLVLVAICTRGASHGNQTTTLTVAANSFIQTPNAPTITGTSALTDPLGSFAAAGSPVIVGTSALTGFLGTYVASGSLGAVPTASILKIKSGGTVVTPAYKTKVGGSIIPVTYRTYVAGAWIPALEGGWPDPPSGMVEWARLELNEGSGTPADTSGNSRTVSIQGGTVQWATEGGIPCLDWDGTDNYQVQIAGDFNPTSKWAIRARVKFISGGFYDWAQNSFGEGGFSLSIQTSNGEHSARSYTIDGSPDANLTFHSSNVIAINEVVDVIWIYTFTGNMNHISYDPDDRTTVLNSGGEGVAANAYETPTSGWNRFGVNGNSKVMRLLDLTMYTNT